MSQSAEFLELGTMLALEAGQIMEAERYGELLIARKYDGTLVTHVDDTINTLVIDAILKHFPDHTILGEESSYGNPNAEHIWCVDPLDGTGEYVESDSNSLTYGFGLAKLRSGRVEMGLFFNPTQDELYTATDETKTHLNDEPIRVNTTNFLDIVKYDYSSWDGAVIDMSVLEQKLGSPMNCYSAIYQACMVARGTSSFSAFPGDTIHDIAPGSILVSHAGGKVTDARGTEIDFSKSIEGAIYSNGIAHSEILAVLFA